MEDIRRLADRPGVDAEKLAANLRAAGGGAAPAEEDVRAIVPGPRPGGRYGDEAGRTWDSRAEERYFRRLRGLQAIGEVLWFTWQVPFELIPPKFCRGRVYICDFLVCYASGQIEAVEIKGTDPKKRKRRGDPLFQEKRAEFAEKYPHLPLRVVVVPEG
jgi:hypothetical protein